MKYLIGTLFLIFISCNEKTKSTEEKSLHKSVYKIWGDYVSSNPLAKNDTIPESWFFHNNKYDADRLATLVVEGKKKASSGLYLWYKEANADLPKVGTKSIVTDFDGKARAIIESSKVDTVPFHSISKDYAQMDMGTTTEPLKKWKKAHWSFFKSAMKESGGQPTEEMLIVCEEFKTIWTYH